MKGVGKGVTGQTSSEHLRRRVLFFCSGKDVYAAIEEAELVAVEEAVLVAVDAAV